jgi:hypothetical protein
MKFFVTNLNNFIFYKRLTTVKDLSYYLSINYNRLVSWLNFQRTPPLVVIDEIANAMQIYPKDLIGQTIDFNKYTFIGRIESSSSEKFCVNLRKYLNKYDIKSAADFVAYFDGVFSEHTYYSYFKNKNSKTPSLKSLEILSQFLEINPHKLIE